MANISVHQWSEERFSSASQCVDSVLKKGIVEGNESILFFKFSKWRLSFLGFYHFLWSTKMVDGTHRPNYKKDWKIMNYAIYNL